MKKTAFTLAEVLITLTIIGVIAAITIPNLMQSWRKHEVEVKLKEAYSILSNATKISESENGPLNELITDDLTFSNYSGITQWCTNYISPYIKYDKVGWSLYSDLGSNFNFTRVDGTPSDGWATNPGSYYSYVLKNGMYMGAQADKNYGPFIRFYVDINGKKAPNRIGVDVFYFCFVKRTRGLIVGFISNIDYIVRESANDCTSNKSSAGYTCSTRIQLNGWKIPDNYPIKKF